MIRVFDAPRGVKDEGKAVNPAYKSYQGIADFLHQFGQPRTWDLSMMEGLGSVAQACLHLGSFNAIVVEKDARIFNEMTGNISQFLHLLEQKVHTPF